MRAAVRLCGGMLLLILLGSDWARYQTGTIAEVIRQNEELVISSASDYFITAKDFATRTRVSYLGESREIPEPRLGFVQKYWGLARARPDIAEIFRHEIHCKEGEAEYWIPIQEPVLEFFHREVADGGEVELFVTWGGTIKVEDRFDWIFFVKEFLAVAGDAAAAAR